MAWQSSKIYGWKIHPPPKKYMTAKWLIQVLINSIYKYVRNHKCMNWIWIYQRFKTFLWTSMQVSSSFSMNMSMAQNGCGRKWVIARLKLTHFITLEIFWVISSHIRLPSRGFNDILYLNHPRNYDNLKATAPLRRCLTQGNCLLRGCLQALFDRKQELSYEMIGGMGDYHRAESGKLQHTKCNWAELTLRFWIFQFKP